MRSPVDLGEEHSRHGNRRCKGPEVGDSEEAHVGGAERESNRS